MSKSYIATLSAGERRELLDDLNYLNMSEIKSFCKRYSIPFRITVTTKDGKTILTQDTDRKGVVLDRIKQFLRTGMVPESTCFPAAVVSFEPLPNKLNEDDRLLYGQYDKTNHAMRILLKSLTDGRFKDGAIARMLARDFWSRGTAPTFAEFAAAWLESTQQHTSPNPEWAYLSDRARSRNIHNWKYIRNRKASRLIEDLNRLVATP